MASYWAGIPSLTPRISDLYGASGSTFRIGEADSYRQDLDELEREEKAFDDMIQELVNCQAAVPIGVKFHRERPGMKDETAVAGSKVLEDSEEVQNQDRLVMRSGLFAEEEKEKEEGKEEDMDEDDMMDEDNEETTGRASIVPGEVQQNADDSFVCAMESEEDSFIRDIESGDESMEIDESLHFSDS